MTKILKVALFGLSAVVLAGAAASPADAKIRCKGPYQVVSGAGEIATPYCEDTYLARIARSYGMKVSNRAVLYNPHKKEEACRFVGGDIRVQHICDQYRYDSNYDR